MVSGTVHGLALNADATRLAVVGPGHGSILDTATREAVTTIPDCRGHAYDVDFAPDGESVVACFHAGHVWQFAADDGRTLQKFVGHSGVPNGVRKVAFSADGARLASVGDDHLLIVWSVASGAELARFEDRSDINTVAWIEDGRVAIGTDSALHVIDVAKRTSLSLDIDATAEVRALPGGRILTAWGDSIRVLDDKLVTIERYAQSKVSRLRATRDGAYVFAGSWEGPDRGVARWSRRDGSRVTLETPSAPVWALALDEAHHTLYAGTSSGLLDWNLADLK